MPPMISRHITPGIIPSTSKLRGIDRTPSPICVFIISTEVPSHPICGEVSACVSDGSQITYTAIVWSTLFDLSKYIIHHADPASSFIESTESSALLISLLCVCLTKSPALLIVLVAILVVEHFLLGVVLEVGHDCRPKC